MSKRVLDILDSLRLRVIRLTGHRESEINIDVFANPEKYLVRLPIEKLVADTKVDPEAIEMYKKKIQNGEKIGPLIVVKHPKFDVYAVLDGHHRYYALLELGKKKVDCALAGDFSSLMFYMTEHGYFQPKPETKEENQKKIIHLHENVQDFLHNFLKDPQKSKLSNKKKSN
jgi:ParB-like nuclease domain